MNKIRKWFNVWGFSLIMLLLIICVGFVMARDVRILPLRGPIGTAQISPANGSATGYEMDFRGQKSICFQNASSTEVYLGSHTAITNSDGWGLANQWDNICMDLKNGTTIYMYGNGASADVRVIIAR